MKMYILQSLTIPCEIGKIHINICFFKIKCIVNQEEFNMACFIVPGTEAIVTTAITKIVEKKEKKEACSSEIEGSMEAIKEEKALPFSRKLKWLNNMLWGGTALLAFEHVWHGEVTPFFPFLTAAGNAQDAVQMLKEMATAGVAMALVVTVVWVGMVAIASGIEKKAVKELES